VAGGSVLVEVTQHSTGPVTRGLKAPKSPNGARQTFEEAVSAPSPLEGVITQLRSVAQGPDEMHIEFGLGLHAEAGAFIVSTTANFTVALARPTYITASEPQHPHGRSRVAHI
jgi:hypothetical protein